MARETLKVREKDLGSFEHSELLKIVVNQKKAELNDLNHKVLLAKNNLRSIEEGCRRTQSEFNQKLATEKQKLESLKVKKMNEYAQSDEKNQQAVRRLNEREMRLQEKESTQSLLETEKKAIYEQRIELEKTTKNYQEQLKRADALQAEATNKINQAAIKEEQAEKKLTEAKQLNSSAENQLNQATAIEKKTKTELNNIQKIREEIEPKIAELQKIEKENEKTLAEAQKKEDEINGKIKQNEQMVSDMKKQYQTFKDKELELASREEEILRQEIVIKKAKGE